MVADDTLDTRFSVMSLAVAADSGWYEVDFGKADLYSWGHKSGCSVFKSRCKRNALAEFCKSTGNTGCSGDFNYISLCKRSKFTAECKLNLNKENCKIFKKSKYKSFRYGKASICQNCKVRTGPA